MAWQIEFDESAKKELAKLDRQVARRLIDVLKNRVLSLRKITKNRGSFPSDEALSKLFYLALRNISQKWNMPIRDWKAALNRFSIEFEDRVPQQ